MSEQVFYDQGGIAVTNSRFIVHGQTYAMSGITSVKASQISPSKKEPVFCVLGGVIITLYNLNPVTFWMYLGIAILVVSIYWFKSLKPTYYVTLTTNAGETQAVQSKDFDVISNIVNALNSAIIERG